MRDVVESNLVASKLNDCGLGTAKGAASGSLSWTFTANTGCGGTLTLKIERGYVYTATLPNPPFQANYTIEGTQSDVELSLSLAVQSGGTVDCAGRELSGDDANQLRGDHAESELKDGFVTRVNTAHRKNERGITIVLVAISLLSLAGHGGAGHRRIHFVHGPR